MARERKIFQIGEEDWNELMRLTKEAQNTPVIALSVKDGLEGRDFASQARERVYAKWREVGKKLGFDGEDIRPANEPERKVAAYPIEEE